MFDELNLPLTRDEILKAIKQLGSLCSSLTFFDIVLMNDRYIRGELDVMFDELNLPLTRDEILKAIKQLKNVIFVV